MTSSKLRTNCRTSFKPDEIDRLKQETILNFLDDPELQDLIVFKAVQRLQQKLEKRQAALKKLRQTTPYAELPDAEKKLKFDEEVDPHNSRPRQRRPL